VVEKYRDTYMSPETSDDYWISVILWSGAVMNHIANVMVHSDRLQRQSFKFFGSASISDPAGTYSVHNIVVETTDDHVKAYISWYWDGMLILDVTDPYNPVEIARYFDNSPEFLAGNGDNPHDFWGVYKTAGRPWIYGSDRNGGLNVFKELGSGSGK
jgi:hypothetical protein